jgi:hypothetical protein
MRKGTMCVCVLMILRESTTNLAKLVPLKLASKLVAVVGHKKYF